MNVGALVLRRTSGMAFVSSTDSPVHLVDYIYLQIHENVSVSVSVSLSLLVCLLTIRRPDFHDQNDRFHSRVLMFLCRSWKKRIWTSGRTSAVRGRGKIPGNTRSSSGRSWARRPERVGGATAPWSPDVSGLVFVCTCVTCVMVVGLPWTLTNSQQVAPRLEENSESQ